MKVLLVTRSDDNESVELVASALRTRGAKARKLAGEGTALFGIVAGEGTM